MADILAAWVQSPDDPTLGGDVVSYELARSTGPNATTVVATIAATVAADDTGYEETITPGTYFYRVRAIGSNGRRSLWSGEAIVTATVQINRVRFTLTGDLVRGVSLQGGLYAKATLRGPLSGNVRYTGALAR